MPLPLPDIYIDRDGFADGPGTQRNLEALANLIIDTGGKSIGLRYGVGLANGGATREGSAVVTHGLGRTPTAVLVVSSNVSLFGVANTVGATTFTAWLVHRDAATWNTDQTFYWIAIG